MRGAGDGGRCVVSSQARSLFTTLGDSTDLDIHIDIARREPGSPVREDQRVNIGLGPFASETIGLLDDHGVRFSLSVA
jgi:hypothetical protein